MRRYQCFGGDRTLPRRPFWSVGSRAEAYCRSHMRGLHPEQVAGVINFVGGWLGEGCWVASTVNHALFERGAVYGRPTIWLYGHNDPFYSIAHSRDNFMAFEKAGGKGKFLEFEAPVGQGHGLVGRPKLWSGPIDSYLNSLAAGVR